MKQLDLARFPGLNAKFVKFNHNYRNLLFFLNTKIDLCGDEGLGNFTGSNVLTI